VRRQQALAVYASPTKATAGSILALETTTCEVERLLGRLAREECATR